MQKLERLGQRQQLQDEHISKCCGISESAKNTSNNNSDGVSAEIETENETQNETKSDVFEQRMRELVAENLRLTEQLVSTGAQLAFQEQKALKLAQRCSNLEAVNAVRASEFALLKKQGEAQTAKICVLEERCWATKHKLGDASAENRYLQEQFDSSIGYISRVLSAIMLASNGAESVLDRDFFSRPSAHFQPSQLIKKGYNH